MRPIRMTAVTGPLWTDLLTFYVYTESSTGSLVWRVQRWHFAPFSSFGAKRGKRGWVRWSLTGRILLSYSVWGSVVNNPTYISTRLNHILTYHIWICFIILIYYYVQYDMFYIVVVIIIYIHSQAHDQRSWITEHAQCMKYEIWITEWRQCYVTF